MDLLELGFALVDVTTTFAVLWCGRKRHAFNVILRRLSTNMKLSEQRMVHTDSEILEQD